MRFRLLIAVFITILACTTSSASDVLSGDNLEPVSLEKLEFMALEHHPSIRAAAARVEKAKGAENEARSALGPKVDGIMSGVRVREPNSSYALDINTGAPIGIVPIGYRDTYRSALVLSQVLYAGGSLTAARLGATYGVYASSAELIRVAQGVITGVRTAFYAHQRAKARLTVAEMALELAQEHYKRVDSFFRAGIVAKSEVLRVQVSVSNAELERIKSISAVATTLTSLERATGVILEKYALPEVAVLSTPNYTVPTDPLGAARESREDLRALGFLRNQAMQVIKSIKGTYLPRVYLQGELSALGDSFWPSNKDDYRVALNLEWRIFDSGERKAKIQQAEGTANEILYNLDEMNNQIRQEVIQAQERLSEGNARVELTRVQVDVAEEDYRLSLKRYESQVGTNLEVLDSRVSLNNARTELVNAVYDTSDAIAYLRYAIGEPIVAEVLKTYIPDMSTLPYRPEQP